MAKHPLPLIIEDTYVRQDDQGRFSLNDLHQAAGSEGRHKPGNWLANQQTQDLIAEIVRCWNSSNGASATRSSDLRNGASPVSVLQGGTSQGTFVARELVYAYAMWISPAFHLKVIRTFDALATGRLTFPGDRPAPLAVGQATGIPTSQLVSLQTHARKLVEWLKAESVRELRADLYAQLIDVYADMKKDPPPLDAIGQEAPDAATEVVEFWTVFKALERLGHPVNHSRNPELVALRLDQVAALAQQERMDVATVKRLKKLLPQSRSPRFLQAKTINSAHAGVSVHCWVFRAQEGGAA